MDIATPHDTDMAVSGTGYKLFVTSRMRVGLSCQCSWNSNGCWRHLVALSARAQWVPVRDGRAVGLQHPGPVTGFLWPGAVFAEDYAADEVVLALGVVVPDWDDDARGFQLHGSDVKADGLVEDGVKRVLLARGLLRFDGLLVVDEREFNVRIWRNREFETMIDMWRDLGKHGYYGEKKSRFWSEAARSARRLIRALTICHMWASVKALFSHSAQFKNNL